MSRRRADVVLVERGVFDSRARARAAIEAGQVIIGGQAITKASEPVDPDAKISAEPAHPWVSRAGLKLDWAFATWPISPEGKVVLDIGASTGGFTEVCLSRGAAGVYAVDVGHGQLHPKVAADARVVSLEGQDARRLDATIIAAPPDMIVCDASFISLEKVLPAALGLAGPAADLICLVKPQFEVGPENVGKGGLVRDAELHKSAVARVQTWLEDQGWPVRAAIESPIAGGEGNIEFLVWAARRQD